MKRSISSKLADPKLLEAIDRLFELKIGEYVALPQILVVGDQSSGKSSVLEGLTGLPYPRDSVLCTRFATHITFRRRQVNSVSVSVIPAVDAKEDHWATLRDWKRDDLQSLDSKTFASILGEVSQLMGLGKQGKGHSAATKKTFSNDVLKIEICGPDQEHYSVIDVPGIFRNTTAGTTTKADMAMVRAMVSGYMENPRSAMLAVIPANVDIGTQEILEMAKEYDPEGLRTLGVLTKPDLVDRGAEHNIIDIVEGKSHALYLGWCIVRNLSQEHLKDSSVDRQTKENEFFATVSPWKQLTKDRVGVGALQKRLVELLGDLIRREFPNVKSDINKRLMKCRDDLVALGPSRETKEQQHKYLQDLSTRYKEITDQALKSHYSDDVFDHCQSLRLATVFARRNETFAHDVRDKGHTFEFKREVDSAPEVTASTKHISSTSRYRPNHVDLEVLFQEEGKMIEPNAKGIEPWLEKIYQDSRGLELGTFDASLLTIVWRKQSANWNTLALGYIHDLVAMVHCYTLDVLCLICKHERIRKALVSVLLEELMERYAKGIDHVIFLLKCERSGTPLTTNHYFADNLDKCRQTRVKALMQKSAITVPGFGEVVMLDNTVRSANTSTNSEYTVCDLHDILKSYYRVARKRFVDNVCMQAGDRFLVTGPDTPIKVFSPSFVSGLTDEQLETIAGESAANRRKRGELRREIESLEKGKKLL